MFPENGRETCEGRRGLNGRDWLFAAALVVAVFLVYQPAWRGGFLWDDDLHVTRPEMRSWHGLYRTWFDVGATFQYYPLLHSAFWVEYQLWDDATLGYHLVNLLLHATAAFLVALLLRRLKIPGAYLAAAIFALHPVHVKSVAWISEQKNVLSAVFYLASALAYLRFDRERLRSCYGWALALFVAAVSSKTVTATLPAALLVVFWWQRGRLSWRRDMLPLTPFFAIGATFGILTAWFERRLVGAEGASFELTLIERCLLAGRAIWFYAGKLFWPSDLLFAYPRWQISQTVWWQYVFPAAALLLLAMLWVLRRRWRGPLAGLLFFAGTLFPALGFVNVYVFIYGFVADHFQYLASLGIITLAAAGMAWLLERWGLWRRPGGYALCLGLLAVLAGLTYRQSRMYIDFETLCQTIIDKNPGSWPAHNTLGSIFTRKGQIDEGIVEFRKALELRPDFAEAHNNLGNALLAGGQFAESMVEFRRALEINPDLAEAHSNLGAVLLGFGRIEEGIVEVRKALELKADVAGAHYNLGNAMFRRGQIGEAIAEYRMALKVEPDSVDVHNNLGNALQATGRVDEAIAELRKALEIKPDHPRAHNNLGDALLSRGQFDEAIAHYQEALEILPTYGQARSRLNLALAQRAEVLKALAAQRESLRSYPNDLALLNGTAWMLATNPNTSIRNGAEAVELAGRAVKLSGDQDPTILATLAAAYAEAGRFSDAVQTARKAANLAARQGKQDLLESLKTQIPLYEAKTPFHETRHSSVDGSLQAAPRP